MMHGTNNRITSLDTRMAGVETKVSSLGSDLNGRINGLNGRIDPGAGESERGVLDDPLRNGAAYGMATIAGIVAVGCAAVGSRPGDCAYAMIYSLPGIAMGAGIGAFVDAHQHETVYDRGMHAAVVPLVSRERIGAQLAVRW